MSEGVPLGLAVAAGGAIGSLGRWGLTVVVPQHPWPWGTLLVNVTGAFAIGLLVAWLEVRDAPGWVRPFAATGLLGGWTTYSAFALEALSLGGIGVPHAAVALVLGIAACVLGLLAGERLITPSVQGGAA